MIVNGLIVLIIFLHGLGHLTCSDIDVLSSFAGASTKMITVKVQDEDTERKDSTEGAFI
jgi:hypothetical protein